MRSLAVGDRMPRLPVYNAPRHEIVRRVRKSALPPPHRDNRRRGVDMRALNAIRQAAIASASRREAAWAIGSRDRERLATARQRSEERGDMMRTWVRMAVWLHCSCRIDWDEPGAGRGRRRARIQAMCMPCHDVGRKRRSSSVRRSTASTAARPARFDGLQLFRGQQDLGHHLERRRFRRSTSRADAGDAGHPHGLRRHQERQGDRRTFGPISSNSRPDGQKK